MIAAGQVRQSTRLAGAVTVTEGDVDGISAGASLGLVIATPVAPPAVLSNGRKKCWLPEATMVAVPSYRRQGRIFGCR